MESRTFQELVEQSPCEGCPAPCCRLQVLPFKTPLHFRDLDYARFILQFPGTELFVSETGDWSCGRWVSCSAFDGASATCTLHDTTRKPRVCVEFSPHGCWYRRNFVSPGAPNIYRLDLRRLELLIGAIRFSREGDVTHVPTFEEARELVAESPIEPVLAEDSALVKVDRLRRRTPVELTQA